MSPETWRLHWHTLQAPVLEPFMAGTGVELEDEDQNRREIWGVELKLVILDTSLQMASFVLVLFE